MDRFQEGSKNPSRETAFSGDASSPDRRLPLEGGANFRDLGGIETRSGETVRRGMLIRGDEMAYLTPRDLDALSSLPLVSIVDFRSAAEAAAAPDKIPSSVRHRYAVNIDAADLSDLMGEVPSPSLDAAQVMESLYRLFVSDPLVIARYREFFRLLQEESNLPLLYHCSAGKDRTGIATALILQALGVNREIIIEDYLLSNSYLNEKYRKFRETAPEMRPLLEVRPQYLLSAFEEIDRRNGSVENFLEQELQVDLARFQAIYLSRGR